MDALLVHQSQILQKCTKYAASKIMKVRKKSEI